MSTEPSDDGLRARMSRQSEETLGRLTQELLDSPLLNNALTRVFDAREKAAQAQELAMGALNLPSAGDLERLTRRVRSVSQRLEGVEDALDRVEARVAAAGDAEAIERRLGAIEQQLARLAEVLAAGGASGADAPAGADVPAPAPRTRTPSRARAAGSKRVGGPPKS